MNWQSEFLDLLMSNSIKSYSAALSLKREHLPKKLYRYRSLNKVSHIIDEICSGKIYLAHPKELNDPFDGCSLIKCDHPSHYFTDQSIFKESLGGHFDDESLAQVFENKDWYNELMIHVAKENTTLEKQEQVVQSLNHAVMKQLMSLNKSFNQIIHNSARIACFTAKNDNLPMWSHYAQNHGGVCLEYEPENIDNLYTVNRLFPVYYSSSIPDILEQSLGKRELEFSIMDYFLIHKLNDWAYECEWRLLYNVGSWYFSYEEVPKEFWMNGKKIQFIRPSKVLLGAKISKEHEKLIRDVCKEYEILVVKMKCTEYGLREYCD